MKQQQSKTAGKYLEVLSANVTAIHNLVSAVRGTVGPKGLDVMLVDQYGTYNCTNDGVGILSSIEIQHPAAKLAVEMAKAQERKVGDGTTTVSIFADSILIQALEKIKNGCQPSHLAKGIQMGIEEAIKILKASSQKIDSVEDGKLLAITKIAARGQEQIAELIVEAAKRTVNNNGKNGQDYFLNQNNQYNFDFADTIKTFQGRESQLIDGLFVKKKSHFNYDIQFKNALVLVIEGAFDPEPISAEAVTTDEGVRRFENHIQTLFETAKKIVKAGVRALFVDASMLPKLEEYFVKENIFVLTRVKKSDLKNIATICKTKMMTREKLLSSDIDQIKQLAGTAESLYEDMELGGFIIKGKKYYQPTVLISAETPSVLNEKERIAVDAAKALQSAFRAGFVLGEGVAELNAVESLESFQRQFLNDVAAGVDTVSQALKALFAQILENAGYEAKIEEILSKLKPHLNNQMGVDLDSGELINLQEAGILDPLEVKISALKIAEEIALQILRINLVLQSK